MTVQELIRRLQTYPPHYQIMILDSFNGGGVPREINHGPIVHKVTELDREESADCEEFDDPEVVIVGYGFY